MQKFDFDFFENFQKTFKGDTENTFPVCLECGGICEYKKISSLLPGEAEFMAMKHGMELQAFRDKYLDGFIYEGQVIDIIKCSVRCPFLETDNSCGARGFKPIMCLIYPIIFEKENDGWKVTLDDRCPLIRLEKTRSFFTTEGIKMVEDLHIPGEWINIDYTFDLYDFDYNMMIAARDVPVDTYKIYTYDEIMKYREV
ncbi:MAG: YkgJ family cysteine cluster protein [Bacteroidota bacterium]